jgi:hypothetical protein
MGTTYFNVDLTVLRLLKKKKYCRAKFGVESFDSLINLKPKPLVIRLMV